MDEHSDPMLHNDKSDPSYNDDDELEKAHLLGKSKPSSFESTAYAVASMSKMKSDHRCSWRCCCRSCGYGILVLLATLFLLRCSTRLERFLLAPQAEEGDDPYSQSRPTVQWGTDEQQYALVNEEQYSRRVENMRQLDQVRFGKTCGHFDEVGKPGWKQSHEYSEGTFYCADGDTYKHRDDCPWFQIERWVCREDHPSLNNVQVTMERIGPFRSCGGHDWSGVDYIRNVGLLRNPMKQTNNTFSFVGGMVAPVYSNGTIISYPPLHIHHAHVMPYGDEEERAANIHGSNADHHDLMFQAHGDSECLPEQGGVACLLYQLDDRGFVVRHDTTGVSANFELNDVRPKGSSVLELWVEITLLHTTTKSPQQAPSSSTFVGLNNLCYGSGPCTYMMPMDLHSNALCYQYVHGSRGSDLAAGSITDFVLHTHHTLFDSAFLFRTTNDEAFQALETFRHGKHFPLILGDCHKKIALEEAKQILIEQAVLGNGATLVCEATRPSLLLDNGHARDKRAQLNCLRDPVPLNVGGQLIVVAFNTVQSQPTMTRSHPAFKAQNAFSNWFAAYQHTIFRFTLQYDESSLQHGRDTRVVPYAPPAYFYYSDLKPKLGFFADYDIAWTCPASIRYGTNNGGWLVWLLGRY